MRSADELRSLVEDGLAEHVPHAELQGLAEVLSASVEGGKRIRGTLCLAVGESLGREPDELLPAALAVERNVLRVAVYELLTGSVPPEVAINEAVELAKRYASDEAGRLVNGILGRIQREEAA